MCPFELTKPGKLMQIEANKVITLNYILKNDAGEVIEQSQDGSFAYLHGANNIIPAMEQALEGHSKDDTLELNLSAAEGYGEYKPELTQVVERAMFEPGTDIQVGMQFHAQSADGQMIAITVKEVDGDNITIDGNHPLAGADLFYELSVVDVRDATDEEIAHGHVHMPGHEH